MSEPEARGPEDHEIGHHRTSGASEMIFMNFLARSSRVTGPKMRVPIGSSCLLMRTAALRSKRMALPSGRRSANEVRTTTARWTSPFLTRPRGMASLMETTMTTTPSRTRFGISCSLPGGLLAQHRLDAGDVAAHLARAGGLLQLATGLLESQVECFLAQVAQLLLELVVGPRTQIAGLHGLLPQ